MTRYRIQITSKAERDFRKLPPPVRSRLERAIFPLESNRFPQQFKRLMGPSVAQYRLRVGDYRILYDVYDDDRVVLILRIGHRKDIYR